MRLTILIFQNFWSFIIIQSLIPLLCANSNKIFDIPSTIQLTLFTNFCFIEVLMTFIKYIPITKRVEKFPLVARAICCAKYFPASGNFMLPERRIKKLIFYHFKTPQQQSLCLRWSHCEILALDSLSCGMKPYRNFIRKCKWAWCCRNFYHKQISYKINNKPENYFSTSSINIAFSYYASRKCWDAEMKRIIFLRYHNEWDFVVHIGGKNDFFCYFSSPYFRIFFFGQ